MGARHALFRPFTAPRTIEIPESPRGWYGADRQSQQGRPQFCRAAVRGLRHTGRGSYLPRVVRDNCPVFRVRQRTQTQAMTSTGAPTVTQATYWPTVPQSSAASRPVMVAAASRMGAAK